MPQGCVFRSRLLIGVDLGAVRERTIRIDSERAPARTGRVIPRAANCIVNDLVVVALVCNTGLIGKQIRYGRIADLVMVNFDVSLRGWRITDLINLQKPYTDIIACERVVLDLVADTIIATVAWSSNDEN